MPQLTAAEIALQKKYAELRKKKEELQRKKQAKEGPLPGPTEPNSAANAVDKAKALLAKSKANAEKDSKSKASEVAKEDPVAAAKRALEAKKSKASAIKRPTLKRPASNKVPSKPKIDESNKDSTSRDLSQRSHSQDKAQLDTEYNRQPSGGSFYENEEFDGDNRSNKRHRGPEGVTPTEEHIQGEATLFVGDLPPYHTQEDLYNTFSHFGPVEHVKLRREECYAFIRFDCKATAQRVLRSCTEKPLVLAGHELRVNESYGTLAEWKRVTPGGGTSFPGQHPKVLEAKIQGDMIADALQARQMLQSHGVNFHSRPQEREIIAYDDL